MLETNYLSYPASIQEAMGMQVDWKGKDPIPPTPQIEMVDLGLTSGKLWAVNNIGATPGETAASYYGDYYAWGEVETKSNYAWSTYKYCTSDYDPNEGTGSLTKYTGSDGKTILEAEDDVVTVTYGSGYVMPTIDDIQELIDETDNEWVTDYNGITGLNGRKFMKKSDHSVFIFIPAAGYFSGSSVGGAGYGGGVWSSSLNSGNPNRAGYLGFGSDSVDASGLNRYYGYSVRPIS